MSDLLTSTKHTVKIRPLTLADLSGIVAVHQAAFPGSAITRLGPEAVRRYYAWQLTGPHDSQNIGAFVDGRLVGFCFGGTFRGALSGYLRENRIFLATRLLVRPWLLADPIFRNRIVRGVQALRRFGRTRSNAHSHPVTEQRPSSFGILSIAVDPQLQGAGVGQVLMVAAEEEARRRGCEQMNLSVSTENQQAIRFYERGGWTRTMRGDKWDGHMTKPVAP